MEITCTINAEMGIFPGVLVGMTVRSLAIVYRTASSSGVDIVAFVYRDSIARQNKSHELRSL